MQEFYNPKSDSKISGKSDFAELKTIIYFSQTSVLTETWLKVHRHVIIDNYATQDVLSALMGEKIIKLF